MVYLFVYGTLKKGFSNHFYLRNSEFVGNSILKGFKMFSLTAYPIITKTNNKDKVVFGEIYKVDSEEIVKDIDILEGGYSKYKTTFQINNKEEDVYFYVWENEVNLNWVEIEGGIF